MYLFLLRHAEAEASAVTDFKRALTPKGEKQAHHVAEFCQQQQILPELVLTSPVLRARQTADIFISHHPTSELMELPALACGMSPDIAYFELRQYLTFESILMVGHEPDLGMLISSLLGASSAYAVHVRKASLTGLQMLKPAPGAGTLEFSIPCKFL